MVTDRNMKPMKTVRILFILLAFTLLGTASHAQESLEGRVYYNANIFDQKFKDALKEATKDMDKDMAEVRQKTIAEKEKKLGRPLNEKELKEVDEKMKEAEAMIKAMSECMKASVTVEFKTDRQLVLKADMSIDESGLKSAGVSWVTRKALKASMSMSSFSQKGTYTVNGLEVYITSGKEKDTMSLSADGQQLFGKMDKDAFTLKRVK